MKPVLFVAFSHQLQPAQIEGLKAQYGIKESDIVLLSKVNPTLAAVLQQIDPHATLVEIKDLAAQVVLEAVKVQATHFFCTGEPTLAMWANLYASTRTPIPHLRLHTYADIREEDEGGGWAFRAGVLWLTCILSTTERKSIDEIQPDGRIVKRSVFSHVQWREMF